jgi:NCAIR mutase (PurE)-related protein
MGEQMNIEDHYCGVYAFNKIAGNLANADAKSVEAQIKVVVEEVKELEKAFAEKDSVELLDGVCDAFVTVAGLMQQMSAAGFNVDKALQRVCENNLTKYPTEVTKQELEAYQWNLWTVTYNKEYDCYVLKDANGKIRKPAGFVSVGISDLVPDNFFGGC